MKEHQQEVAEVAQWFASDRFEGIVRADSPEQVQEQRLEQTLG